MRDRPRSLSTTVALVCCALAAAPTVGTAAQPGSAVGDVIAQDVRETPVADEQGRLVIMTYDGAVALLDPREAQAGTRELSRGCTFVRGQRTLVAAAEGFALLDCVTSVSPYGPVTGPHVLDLATGALIAPAIPAPIATWDYVAYTGIEAAGVCVTVSAYKSGSRTARFDWRDGHVDWGVEACRGQRRGLVSDMAVRVERPGGAPLLLAPAPRESGGTPFVEQDDAVVVWGIRTVAPLMDLYAYLRRCGVRLGWKAGPLTRAVPVPDGLVLAESTRGSGPVTLRLVDLAGVCDDVTTGWRLAVASGGRRVLATPRTASGDHARSGAQTALLDPGPGTRALTLGRSGRLAVRTNAPASSVRWRLGRGKWHAARRSEGRWTVGPVRRDRVLRLAVHLRNGAATRYEVPLR